MQKNTQELIDSELLDTLKRHYYFLLEEKFRLYQRASFLFVLLVPMFFILFQLFDEYNNSQPLVILFLVFLAILLFFSVFFLGKSFAGLKKKYAYIDSPEKIIKHYEYEIEYYKYQKRWQKSDPNFVPLVKKLSLQYSEASIQNRKIIETFSNIAIFFCVFFNIKKEICLY